MYCDKHQGLPPKDRCDRLAGHDGPCVPAPKKRTYAVTDWSDPHGDQVDPVDPGDEHVRMFRPRMFVAIRKILVSAGSAATFAPFVLSHVQIGAVKDVPFALETVDGPLRTYRLGHVDDVAKHPDRFDDEIKRRLLANGSAVLPGDHGVAVVPGLDVVVTVCNAGPAPAKPHVALIVQGEEIPR